MAKIKPIPSEVFTANNQTALIKTINALWDMQIDTLTQQRVIEALELDGIPKEWLNELTENIDFFLNNQMNPIMTNKVELAGNQMVDMVDEMLAYTPGDSAAVFMDREISILSLDLKNPLSSNFRDVLQNAIDNNWTVTQTKQMMTPAMTLTDRDSKAVVNFTLNLPDDLTQKQKAFRTTQYTNKMKRLRSERIARTELTRVKHFGEMDALNQNMGLGLISKATKIWNRASFKDNWESSIVNDGVEVGINEPFPMACETGNAFYPSEINENCYLDYEVK